MNASTNTTMDAPTNKTTNKSTNKPFVILIVDDKPNNLFTLQALLKGLQDCEIVEANSGAQALSRVVERPIDLILLDVQMPGMDGFDTARHLQMTERTRNIPILFVTAVFNAEEFISRGFEVGAVDYLTKPIDDNLLLNRIRLYRGIHQRERQLTAMVEQLRRNEQANLALTLAKLQAEAADLAKSRYIAEIEQAEDISREAARYARSLIEASLDPLVAISAEGKITDVNVATERVTGVDRVDMIGSDFAGYFTDPEKGREGYRQVFAQGFVTDYPLAIRHVSGKMTDVLYNASVYRDAQGNVLGVFAAARDITERKQAEERLKRSNTDLQRFAEVTAHHLQEPARRMASYAGRLTEQLGDRLDEAEARLSLKFIGQQALRQKQLLRDVERYLAADQPRGEIGAVDTGKAVTGILTRMADRISETGAEIMLGNLPPTRIDLPRLDDVFSVALENTLAHGRGALPLRVTIAGERRGSKVRYSISDNGPGVEEEYREQVFGVFERLKPGDEGTGIGLAILRRVVESCDGRAWIEAAPGGGCRVLFELPIGEPL